MRRLSYFFFILVIVAGFVGLGMVTGASAKDIKVGAILNLTGPLSSWGQYHYKGLKDYMRYVNEVKGGIGFPAAEGSGRTPVRVVYACRNVNLITPLRDSQRILKVAQSAFPARTVAAAGIAIDVDSHRRAIPTQQHGKEKENRQNFGIFSTHRLSG